MAEDRHGTDKRGCVGCLFSKASGASVIFALSDVLHSWGLGSGRRLPFGSCMLFKVTQAGSFSSWFLKPAGRLWEGGGKVQWRRAPRSGTLLSRLWKGMCQDHQGSGCWVRLLLLELPQRKCCSDGSAISLDGLWPWSAGGEAGVFPQIEVLTSLYLSTVLLQEMALFLPLVETCPSFSHLLWFSYQIDSIFLVPVQSASFIVGSEPNAVFASRHCIQISAV